MTRYTQLAGRAAQFTGMNVQSRLPDHYIQFLAELKQPAERVHDYKEPADLLDYKIADPTTRRVTRVPDTPVHVIYPQEADQGIWGGEGIVKGFIKKRIFYGRYLPMMYMPNLIASQVYSEVLDMYLKVTVTERALMLFDKAHGFDGYILRTPVQDFKSQLALRLRRKMLLTLAKGDYFPNDPERREYIRQKYADCVIPYEQADWFGLTMDEAMEKLTLQEHRENPVTPLKFQYRKELIAMLKERKEKGLLDFEESSAESSVIQVVRNRVSGLFARVRGQQQQQRKVSL